MKFLSIFIICIICIGVHSFEDKYWVSNNNVNSIIREWKRNSYKKNKNTKCKSFSIYQNDKLIKTNIPINYREVDLENINIIQDVLLTLKCDKFIKYLKVKREVTSNGNENSESESGTVSVEESEDEVDPIFNIIDNEFDQINKNEDKEDNIDNSFIPVHPNNTNTNKNDKSKESTTNNNDNNNNNSKQTTIENKPSIHAISGKNNQSEKNKTPVKTTKNDKNKTSDKINNKNDKTSANNNNKANNSNDNNDKPSVKDTKNDKNNNKNNNKTSVKDTKNDQNNIKNNNKTTTNDSNNDKNGNKIDSNSRNDDNNVKGRESSDIETNKQQ
jgi:hypothetical protein